jgi:hypothetical protein
MPEVPGEIPSLQLLSDVRRAVGESGGIEYSHTPDDDVAREHRRMCLSQYGRTDQRRNWVLFRFRPNGDDPDTCLYDVMFLHRYPEGEEPTVEHEWYPMWHGHDDWGASIGQDLSNMGHVQARMHQSTCKGLRLNRQEAGIRNHERFLDGTCPEGMVSMCVPAIPGRGVGTK